MAEEKAGATDQMNAEVLSLPSDPEIAMQKIKGDVSILHNFVSNVAHFTSAPVTEIEHLIASIMAHLSVVRSKL